MGPPVCFMELALDLKVCTGFGSILRGNSKHRSHMSREWKMTITGLGKRRGVRLQNPLRLEEEPKGSLKGRGLGFRHKWLLKLR